MADLHCQCRVQRTSSWCATQHEQQCIYNSTSILEWTATGRGKEDVFRKKLFDALEIQYDRFPQSKKNGHSLLGADPRVLVRDALLDDPEHEEPARRACARRAVAGSLQGGSRVVLTAQ